MSFHVPEQFRISGVPGTNSGWFILKEGRSAKDALRVHAVDGLAWECVHVTKQLSLPSWSEMCFVKALFWDDVDTVLQYHLPNMPQLLSLSLWRSVGIDVPIPPQ